MTIVKRAYNRKWRESPNNTDPDQTSYIKTYTEYWRRNNPERVMLNAASRRSKQIGVEYSISLKDIVVPTHCPLLGIKLSKGRGERDAVPSLDRLDNTKGYTPDNVWVISYKANRMKNSATLEELDIFCKKWMDFRNA